MKVGDLVKLSAYGKARDYNKALTHRDPNQLGLIVKVVERSSYPYKVRWPSEQSFSGHAGHCRRELAFASKGG